MVSVYLKTALFRLSEWGPAMEHGEPGQVGNQAAISHPFLVSDSTPADECFVHFGIRRVTGGVPGT